jgi:hypothetical protein
VRFDVADQTPASRSLTTPGFEANNKTGDRHHRAWVLALPFALAGALGAWQVLAVWASWRKVPSSPTVRVSAELGADTTLVTDQGAAAILSPDDAWLAFVG